MTKINVFSGFLGAGKTTLIRKLLKEAFAGEQVVLIENEFGEIGIDGGFLKEAGIEIREMNSGCICCSLVGDFATALKDVIDMYHPARVLIEPSGVGKLSDVIRAVENGNMEEGVTLDSAVAVVDASKAKLYCKNFGEFFINQIEHAGTIVLSRTGKMEMNKIEEAVALIREHNPKAVIVTTPWDEIDGMDIVKAMDGSADLKDELIRELMARHDEDEHHHHHEHDEDEHEHEHHHHHEHDEDGHEHHHHEHDEDGHEHHHHEHDEDEHGHEHHHHEHDEHEHHHHHHADEVFTSWGMETPVPYSMEDISRILKELADTERYGTVLRAKGMVPGEGGTWIYFDYVPQESDVREGKPDVTGKFCVIGSQLKEDKLKELFTK